MAHSVQLTRALDNIAVYIWPDKVVSVRVTGPDDVLPQGTLICSTSAAPDNRIVVKEAVNIVVAAIDRANRIPRVPGPS